MVIELLLRYKPCDADELFDILVHDFFLYNFDVILDIVCTYN